MINESYSCIESFMKDALLGHNSHFSSLSRNFFKL